MDTQQRGELGEDQTGARHNSVFMGRPATRIAYLATQPRLDVIFFSFEHFCLDLIGGIGQKEEDT